MSAATHLEPLAAALDAKAQWSSEERGRAITSRDAPLAIAMLAQSGAYADSARMVRAAIAKATGAAP